MGRIIFILVIMFTLGCGKSSSAGTPACANSKMSVAQGRVKVNPEVMSSQFKKMIVVRKDTEGRGAKVETVEIGDEQREGAVQQWLNDESVDYVEPDYPIQVEEEFEQSADPFSGKQWALEKVQTEDAWGLSVGNRKIVVAVIDSGVDINHPDLKANIWTNPNEVVNGKDDDGNGKIDDIHGWDFANNDNSPRPDSSTGSSHGTHVSGIIGGVVDNGVGIAGLAPQVRIMPLRFIGDSGGGDTSNAAKAVYYAIEKKVDVINMSFGSTHYSQTFYDALTKAEAAGITIVVAAGNSKLNLDKHNWYPTKYPHKNIITVAATNSKDEIWASSSQGSNYSATYVDVAAPGVSIYSTVNSGQYSNKTGTSMAAPLVAGLAVLLKGEDSSLTYNEIIFALKKSVDPLSALKTRTVAGGRVNAYEALEVVARKNDFVSEMDQETTCQ